MADEKDQIVPGPNPNYNPDSWRLGSGPNINRSSKIDLPLGDPSRIRDSRREELQILAKRFGGRYVDELRNYDDKVQFNTSVYGLASGPVDPTPRLDSPKGNLGGGGAKSTYRPPAKNFSAFGRNVPYAGYGPEVIKSGIWKSAVGSNNGQMPGFGFASAIWGAGAFRIMTLNHDGAFPIMPVTQFQSSSAPAYENFDA